MPWSSSRRKERFNPDWPRVRRLVGERDGWRCQWPVTDWRTGLSGLCLAPGNEVDHKVRAEDGAPDDDSLENLWVLCEFHHAQKTHAESVDARRKRRERAVRAEHDAHPGYHVH